VEERRGLELVEERLGDKPRLESGNGVRLEDLVILEGEWWGEKAKLEVVAEAARTDARSMFLYLWDNILREVEWSGVE